HRWASAPAGHRAVAPRRASSRQWAIIAPRSIVRIPPRSLSGVGASDAGAVRCLRAGMGPSWPAFAGSSTILLRGSEAAGECPDSEVRLSFAARADANFGIEGHSQLYDSSAALNPKFADEPGPEYCANFGFGALGNATSIKSVPAAGFRPRGRRNASRRP